MAVNLQNENRELRNRIATLKAERYAAQRELADLREAANKLLNASAIWASPPLGASIDELAESFKVAEAELREAIAAQKGERDELKKQVRELVEAVAEDEIEVLFYGTDKIYSGKKYAAISISNLHHIQSLAAQLNEQDNE